MERQAVWLQPCTGTAAEHPHKLLVALGDAGHVPGHGRRGGAGSPAPQPTREQEHFNPSYVPLPHLRDPLLCCATAQEHPQTSLSWLLVPQGAGGLGLPADPS